MTKSTTRKLTRAALLGSASLALMLSAAHAEQAVEFKIESGSLVTALNEYARQSDQEILFSSDIVAGKQAKAVNGVYEPAEALELILVDTGLVYAVDDGDTVLISDPTKEAAAPRTFRVAQVDQEFSSNIERIDSANQQDEPDVIIVTGTNIRGAKNPASPVFVFDREAIELTGAATTQQLIRTLPQNQDFSENTGFASAGPGTGVGAANAGINIRGLGAGATLTLVNGRRLAAGGGDGSFVDISLIPLTAVERVEVLTDGASAIYGADAVAGVVNFILRDDYEGAETRLRVGGVTQGSSQEYQAAQTLGRTWDGGNFLATYEYYKRNALDSNSRSFSEDAADPTELLPDRTRHSVFVSGRQDVSDRIELFGTGTFSTTDTEILASRMLVTGGVTTDLGITDISRFGGVLGSSIEFANDWSLEVSGAFNRNETENELVRQGSLLNSISLDFDLWTVDVMATGSLLRLPGGDVRVAVGGQFRNENFNRIFSSASASDSALDLNRSIYSLFGELYLPLVGDANQRPGFKALDLSVAGRWEDYSDFGSTLNPKIGLHWAIVDDLSIRGTFSTSFLAPRFNDLGAAQRITAFPGIFFPAPPGSTDPSPNVLQFSGGNSDLEPEESTSWTLGFDYRPTFAEGLELSATFFDIDFENRIAVPVPGSALLSIFLNQQELEGVLDLSPDPTVIADAFASPTFLDLFGLTASDIGAILDNRRQNISVSNVRGVDLNIGYSAETTLGDLSFSFNGSYIDEFRNRVTPTSASTNVVDTAFNPVDFRFRTGVGWRRGGLSANVFVNYTDDYTSDTTGADTPVSSWTTLDLNLSYDTEETLGASILHDVKVTFNVQNLLNEDPPFVGNPTSNVNFDGTNANALGRFVSLQIQKSF